MLDAPNLLGWLAQQYAVRPGRLVLGIRYDPEFGYTVARRWCEAPVYQGPDLLAAIAARRALDARHPTTQES